MKFVQSTVLKSIIRLLPCIDFLPWYNFRTPYIGHLENIGLLSYADLPNIDISF